MRMSNGFLSQEEINSLLRGEFNTEENSVEEELLTDIEKDLLGEVGNISMGSASTALHQLVNQKVNITTPVVTVTTIKEIKDNFDVPNVVLDVEYVSGIVGRNILMIKKTDAAVIANLMMGGDGNVENPELSELEISAVQEAMNQMIGSAATSMATMFSREVNISPPQSTVWDDRNQKLTTAIDEDESIVRVSFSLTIGEILESKIMQILPIDTAKRIVSIMMGDETNENDTVNNVDFSPKETIEEEIYSNTAFHQQVVEEPVAVRQQPTVEVQKATFAPLEQKTQRKSHDNIDLILDVPLQVSVVLGRTKKSIRDILSLGNGSLIELDKLADEPVEVLVNGKVIAEGEVVVVDENFGVRINNIISGTDRIKSLK